MISRALHRVWLHAQCIYFVAFVRIGLWLTTYQNLHAWLVRPCGLDPQADRRSTVVRSLRAISRTARFVPDASCLTQCLSLQALLSRKGIPSTITMGVAKGDENAIEVHAWLVWNDIVVLQGTESTLRRFAKIMDVPTPVCPPAARK